MAFPTSAWPGAVDPLEPRSDFVDWAYADDFNYNDTRIVDLQNMLGDGVGEVIGELAASNEGPGGLASPVADGGVALKLAAKNTFTSGDILQVLDGGLAGTVKAKLNYAGLLWSLAGFDASSSLIVPYGALPAAGTQGRLQWDTATPGLVVDDGADWVPVSSGGTPGAESNLWAHPETPHAEDDEFESGTLDAAWYTYDIGSTTFGSFLADAVDPYDGTHTVGIDMRTSLNSAQRRSWILLQPVNNRGTIFGKAYTLPTNAIVYGRFRFGYYLPSFTSGDRVCGLVICGDDGGKPDWANEKVYLMLNTGWSGEVKAGTAVTVGGTESGWVNTDDTGAEGQALEYCAIHKVGTTYHAWVGTANGHWIWMASHSGPASIGHIGGIFTSNTVTKPGSGVFGVDFIRVIETNEFLM